MLATTSAGHACRIGRALDVLVEPGQVDSDPGLRGGFLRHDHHGVAPREGFTDWHLLDDAFRLH